MDARVVRLAGRGGEGWRVGWRAWTGGGVLMDRKGSEEEGERNGDEEVREEGGRTSKKARRDAFEEILAEEQDDDTLLLPRASTSKKTGRTAPRLLSLKEKLEALQKSSEKEKEAGNDPFESARQHVVDLATRTGGFEEDKKGGVASLMSHVQFGTVMPLDARKKGKGKAEEGVGDDAAVSRVLWVFEISRAGEEPSDKMDMGVEGGSLRSLLDELKFEGLQGTLFPGFLFECTVC